MNARTSFHIALIRTFCEVLHAVLREEGDEDASAQACMQTLGTPWYADRFPRHKLPHRVSSLMIAVAVSFW